MILVDWQIREGVENGDIAIEPFNDEHVNTNSYDITLGKTLLVYKEQDEYDLKDEWDYEYIDIPEEGLVLEPGKLYLGITKEVAGSDKHVAILEGRSSVGRAGVHIHITAGFGDLGYRNRWTLEIHSMLPVRIYAGMRIGQVYFLTAKEAEQNYRTIKNSKYFETRDKPLPTMLYKDFR